MARILNYAAVVLLAIAGCGNSDSRRATTRPVQDYSDSVDIAVEEFHPSDPNHPDNRRKRLEGQYQFEGEKLTEEDIGDYNSRE